MLAAGRVLALTTMWMNGVGTDWYIGLLTSLDPTKVYDSSEFLDLISESTELRDYSVVRIDDSLLGDKRILYTPDDYTLQAVDNQITSSVDDNSLMRFKYTGTSSAYVVGMFLCNREDRDNEPCLLYSIGQILPAVTLYPGDITEITYTPVYQ